MSKKSCWRQSMIIKGRDIYEITIIVVASSIIGLFIFGYKDNANNTFFTELITFLSIMFGFQITAFSILFNSRSLSTLHSLYDEEYDNRLDKLSRYFRFAFYIEFFIISGLFIAKQFNFVSVCVLPILAIVGWCFYKISKVLFEFFNTPRNP